MKELKHQQQPTGNTCTSACLAMLLDEDVSGIVDEFHQAWRAGTESPATFLKKRGVDFLVHGDPYDNRLEWGKVFLLTVPSLNIIGGLHHIVIDLRDEVKVLDPNKGKEWKKYYISWDAEPKKDEVRLHAWDIDMEVNIK